jgi:hypothetical protein
MRCSRSPQKDKLSCSPHRQPPRPRRHSAAPPANRRSRHRPQGDHLVEPPAGRTASPKQHRPSICPHLNRSGFFCRPSGPRWGWFQPKLWARTPVGSRLQTYAPSASNKPSRKGRRPNRGLAFVGLRGRAARRQRAPRNARSAQRLCGIVAMFGTGNPSGADEACSKGAFTRRTAYASSRCFTHWEKGAPRLALHVPITLFHVAMLTVIHPVRAFRCHAEIDPVV